MKKKSIVGLLLIGTLTLGSLVSCDMPRDSDKETKNQQEQLLQQANDQVGMPNITNFYEKKLRLMTELLKPKLMKLS
jgi:mannose/fructose/N-acetylgalactosamine-specific phosphotransferase system component IID